VAGAPENGVLPVTVKGVPKNTSVSVQIGPALPGTAVRDATGEISFGQFVNQVEFADAATALNNEIKAQVLKGLEPGSLEGERVTFTGAFAYLAPNVITITPVRLEAG
jgi:predicted lipoprotein